MSAHYFGADVTDGEEMSVARRRVLDTIEGLRSSLAIVKADLEACDADRDVEITKTRRLEAELAVERDQVTRLREAATRAFTLIESSAKRGIDDLEESRLVSLASDVLEAAIDGRPLPSEGKDP